MSRCLRRSAMVGSRVVALCLPSALSQPSPLVSTSLAFGGQHRHKTQRIKIANRRKVEMFVGTRFHLPTRLRTAAPDIAAEWDHERNPGHEYPEIIGIGHMAPVWWKCGVCGSSYRMSVEKRVVRGGGCECCATAARQETERAARLDRTAPRMGNEKDDGAREKVLRGEDLLEGEVNPANRSKRSTMLSMRTKY